MTELEKLENELWLNSEKIKDLVKIRISLQHQMNKIKSAEYDKIQGKLFKEGEKNEK